MALSFDFYYLKSGLPEDFPSGLSSPVPTGVVILTVRKDFLSTLAPVREYTLRAISDCFYNGTPLLQQFNSDFYHYVLPAATEVMTALSFLGASTDAPLLNGSINSLDPFYPFFEANLVQGLFSSYIGDDRSICVLDVCSPRFTQSKIKGLVPRGLELVASRYQGNSKLGIKFDNPIYDKVIAIYLQIGYSVKKIDTLLGGRYNGFTFLLMQRPGGSSQPIRREKQETMLNAARVYKSYFESSLNIVLRIEPPLIKYLKHLVNDYQNETGGVFLGKPIEGTDRVFQLYLPCFLETKNPLPIDPSNVVANAYAPIPHGYPVTFHTHPPYIGRTINALQGYVPSASDNLAFLMIDFYNFNVLDYSNAFTHSALNFVFAPEGAYTYTTSAPFYETLYQISRRTTGYVTINQQAVEVNPLTVTVQVADLITLFIFLVSAYIDIIRVPGEPTRMSQFVNTLFSGNPSYNSLLAIEFISTVNMEMVQEFYRHPPTIRTMLENIDVIDSTLKTMGYNEQTRNFFENANDTLSAYEQMYKSVSSSDPRFMQWDVLSHISILTVSLYHWPEGDSPMDIQYTNKFTVNPLQSRFVERLPAYVDSYTRTLVTSGTGGLSLEKFNEYVSANLSQGRNLVYTSVQQCEGVPPVGLDSPVNPSIPPPPNSIELPIVV